MKLESPVIINNIVYPNSVYITAGDFNHANLKSVLNNNETDVNVSLGWEELRETMKESMMRERKRLWQNDTKGRRYFSFQPQVKSVFVVAL